jgi:hypothetical protein
MKHPDDQPDWQEQINAMLDGELTGQQLEQLKTAAKSDAELAAAIISAYQLQQALGAIPQERAPASLRSKLADIPRLKQQSSKQPWFRTAWLQPRWAMALAAVPLVLIAVSQMRPAEPSPEEIARAQQELFIALTYLGKVGRKTRMEIGTTVNQEVREPVNENMIQTIQLEMELNKERKA